MARPAKQSDNYDYNVESVKLLTPEGNESGWLANRRTDNGEVLGVSTEQYTIVQNRDLFGRADEIIADRGLTPSAKTVIVSDGGAKVRGIYDFKDAIQCKVPQVGDSMGFRLIVNNSFDRSLRISFALGLLRLVCTNGMTTLEKEFDLTRKHSKHVNIGDMLTSEKLDKAIECFQKSVNVYGRLAEVEIKQEDGLTILQKWAKANIISEKLREPIARIWNEPTFEADKDRNLYNLNNAVTQVLTSTDVNAVRAMGQDAVATNRWEYSNRISNQVLRGLNKAANSKAVLAKLIKPLPVVEVANN